MICDNFVDFLFVLALVPKQVIRVIFEKEKNLFSHYLFNWPCKTICLVFKVYKNNYTVKFYY